MSRWVLAAGIAAVLAATLLESTGRAQSLEPPERATDLLGLSPRDFARARAEALAARLSDLERARLEAIRSAYDGREREFLAARGRLDLLLADSEYLLQAELALATTAEAKGIAFERFWQRAFLADWVTEFRHAAGRVPDGVFARTRLARLEAEARLLEARRTGPAAVLPAGEPRRNADEVPLKEIARARFEASRRTPEELGKHRIAAARLLHEARLREFLDGRGAADSLLEVVTLLAATLEAVGNEATRYLGLEMRFAQAVAAEAVNTMRSERGRITVQDYLEWRAARLDAEIRLREARPPRSRQTYVLGDRFEGAPGDIVQEHELDRQRYAAQSADLPRLKRARLDALRGAYEARAREFLSGRHSVADLAVVGRRLHEAAMGVAGSAAERVALLEIDWARAYGAEQICAWLFAGGRIGRQDYEDSRYFRLDAQIRWLQAR